MNDFDAMLRAMNFDYFGESRHKTTPAAFFTEPDAVFLDLRSEREHALLPIHLDFLQTRHVPLNELPDRHGEIPADKPVGLFCSSDTRSAIALAYLKARGYESVKIVAGGYEALVGELKPGKVAKLSPAGA